MLHSEPSLNTWVTLCVKGQKRLKTTSFTKWLFDLDAPANVFWLTQSVPLASMLLEATRSPTVCCNGQGSGLLLHRQHRHRVYCPRGWLASRPAVLLHLCPLCRMTLYCYVHLTSAVAPTLSSPLICELHALLVMRSENKHRRKDGKTRDISQRNTTHAVYPWYVQEHFLHGKCVNGSRDQYPTSRPSDISGKIPVWLCCEWRQ